MAGIEVTVHRVVEILERCGLRYAVTGMLAGGVHGYPRQTIDVDISIAAASQKEWEETIETLKKEGFVPGKRPDIHGFGIALLESPDGWGVDVFFEDEAEVFERARKVEYYGKPVFFVSLEDLVRQKLKMGPRLKDTSDIIALLKTNEDKIDWSYFDRKLDDEEREKLNKLWRVARGELEATAVFDHVK
jgi:hypothetical protein